MNEFIIKEIANELNIKISQVETVLKLLEDGNTIPFIARYRKEATGALDEEQIRQIDEVYQYQVNLAKRKEDVIRLIDEKGLLTDELKDSIMNCTKLVEVEDLYRPYKEKKKTKATEAIKNGLEPLAKEIMAFPVKGNIEEMAKRYLNDAVTSIDKAIEGAKYIIAENISDDAKIRKSIRDNTYNFGIIKSKIKKNAKDENKIYDLQIFDYLTGHNPDDKIVRFAKTLNVAGNLDSNKCQYIKGLNNLDQSVKVNLYGLNFNQDALKSKSVHYMGAFPADDIPAQLTEGFGLVWDGDTIASGAEYT